MDLKKFGSAERPLRASALPMLVRCPHRAALIELATIVGGSSKAADTGSAVHAAVHEWNQTGDVAKALEAMRTRHAEFPQADLEDARLSVVPYCRDPRNAPSEVLKSEIQGELTLDSPDGVPIVIYGRIRADGVWDVKTGDLDKTTGWAMMHDYSYQLAAYAKMLGVLPGGLICTKGYRKRSAGKEVSPPGVFWPTNWSERHIDVLLAEVVDLVVRMRAGEVPVRPGPHCSFCPANSFQECIDMRVA
jgi:hypothetical protein